MAATDTPVEIYFELDKRRISGTVEGSASNWVFKSQNEYFARLVGEYELSKAGIAQHKHRYNLKSLEIAITAAVEELHHDIAPSNLP
jgi:hypothetical protein